MTTGKIGLREKTWVTVEIDGTIEESVTDTLAVEWTDAYLSDILYEIQLDWGTGIDFPNLAEWAKEESNPPLELEGWSETCAADPSYKRKVTYFLERIEE